MAVSRGSAKQWLSFFLINLVGSGIFAVGVQYFTAPNQIAPGGVTGLATIMHSLWGLPIGAMTFVINLPLLILSWFYISKSFTIRTTMSTLILSVLTDVAGLLISQSGIPPYTSDSPVAPLLAALFGGGLMGVGNAMAYMVQSTTGGTAIVGALLQKRFRHLSMGKLLLIANFIVVIISVFVYRNIDTGLFATLCIFTASIVMDNMIYGLNTNRLLFIISDKSREIEQRILTEMHRGVTILKGEGGYRHSQKDIIFCVASKAQFYRLRQIALGEDENAFIVGCEAGDVLGKGFKHLD